MSDARWLCRKYSVETRELAGYSDAELDAADCATERWRDSNGCPAPNSPLGRGHFMDAIRATSTGDETVNNYSIEVFDVWWFHGVRTEEVVRCMWMAGGWRQDAAVGWAMCTDVTTPYGAITGWDDFRHIVAENIGFDVPDPTVMAAMLIRAALELLDGIDEIDFTGHYQDAQAMLELDGAIDYLRDAENALSASDDDDDDDEEDEDDG